MSKRRLRFLCGLTSIVAVIVLGGAAQAAEDMNAGERTTHGIVQSVGHYSTKGFDPVERAAEMAEASLWLQSERAPLAAAPGISASLTLEDRINIGLEPCDDCDGRILLQPNKRRVGVVKQVEPAVKFENLGPRALSGTGTFAQGALRQLEDGIVWSLAVQTPDAAGLRIHFTDFELPEGVEVWVYNDRDQAFGPYTGRGWWDDGEFWSHTVSGSVVYVQLRTIGPIAPNTLRAIRFDIPEVGYLGSQISSPVEGGDDASTETNALCSYNEDCILNAACENMPSGVMQAREGVAFMRWISGAFINICTGGLVADTDMSSEVPLFLTANHCMSKNKDAKNLEAYFSYETSCGGSCPGNPYFDTIPAAFSIMGATVLKSGQTSDYTLMELKQDPPTGTPFIGFDNAEVAFSPGTMLYRISHPAGAPQAYSQQNVANPAFTCLNTDQGDWIYSTDQDGATEGGSSGSPVLNGAGKIVGQLTGACGTNTGQPCDSASNYTIDGALAAYYPSVAEWLDPNTTCTPTEDPEVSCDDGVDNDCDGAQDCSDSDCSDDPACQSGGCTLGQSGDICTSNAECCSNKCKGPPSGRTCR